MSGRDAPGDSNGFEGDNDPNASANEPVSEPTIWNATLCGPARVGSKPRYGMLLRRSTRAVVRNAIVTGFDAGIDVRDRTLPDVRSSAFFANGSADFGAPERAGTSEGPLADDDEGLDEAALIGEPSRENSTANPGIVACLALANEGPRPAGRAPDAAAPPDDGFFDPTAGFLGAFRGSDDRWDAGRWALWK